MRVNIFTNASAAKQTRPGIWQVQGIPMTVDNAVMNGIFYEDCENVKGLNSYRGRPVTLRHPEDENGNPTSAHSADGLMNHFSGGVIVNTYNHNGINYADAEFKESMLLAQDNGEQYLNKFKSGEPIGVSTGLYFDGNNESGVAANGEKYQAKAINQVGDHLAMLPDDEPPAGGEATFIRFNGENGDQTLAINIDEFIANLDIDKKGESLFSKIMAACKQTFAPIISNGDNDNEFNQSKEGDAMKREELVAALNAKKADFNKDASEAELLVKLMESSVPDVESAINSALQPLSKKIDKLENELTENANKDLVELAKKAAPLMGLEEDEAKALGANALHKVLAKNGVTIGAPNASNSQSPKLNDGESLTKFWEAK